MRGLLTIECFNYKQHKNKKIILNGNSAILMGDIKTGKSNIQKLVLAHLGLTDYPTNPLSDDEMEGSTKTTHLAADGKVYTIQRKFKRDPETKVVTLDRLWVYPPVGQRSSLESMSDTVFGGAFKNGFFDYIEYFYKNKTPVTRGAYFIKAIGGADVEKNTSDINKWKRQRGEIGTQKDQKKAIFSAINYNPETFDADYAKYNKEQSVDSLKEATTQYVQDNLVDIEKLNTKISAQKVIMAQVKDVEAVVLEYDFEIAELEKQLELAKKMRSDAQENKAFLLKQVLDTKKFQKLLNDIDKAEAHNNKVWKESTIVYDKALEEFMKFREEKAAFFSGLEAYDEWEKLDAEWNDLDTKISDAMAENEEIFRSRIPIPELTIGEEDGKPVVLYNGKDFSEDNLSTGERLAITTAIQAALNPNGDNFIIVPEAQSLGSELPLVLNELDKHNVQYLVEMTYPDEEFKVEIIERKVDGAAE